MSDFKVAAIDHVELFVPERWEAAAWYRRVLGLEILSDFEYWATPGGGPLMISPDGGVTKLALFEGPVSDGKAATNGFHTLAFRVDGEGFRAFLDRLDEIELIDHFGRRLKAGMAKDHDGSWSVYFDDPWGHHLEVTTYEAWK